MDKDLSDDCNDTLQSWMVELYDEFEYERGKDFTKDELMKASQLVNRMLRLEPSERASVADILADEWFETGAPTPWSRYGRGCWSGPGSGWRLDGLYGHRAGQGHLGGGRRKFWTC